MYWNEYKAKSEDKNMTNEYRYFQTLYELTDCLYWFIQIKITPRKGMKPEDIFYQKVLLSIITSSSLGKTFMTNPLILI